LAIFINSELGFWKPLGVATFIYETHVAQGRAMPAATAPGERRPWAALWHFMIWGGGAP